MQLSNLLIAVMAATVSADCHRSGDKWNNRVAAREAITKACSKGGELFGSYGISQMKPACANSGDKQKMNFEVQNTANSERTLSVSECIYRLYNEVNGCDRGGRTTADNWVFQ